MERLDTVVDEMQVMLVGGGSGSSSSMADHDTLLLKQAIDTVMAAMQRSRVDNAINIQVDTKILIPNDWDTRLVMYM